MKIEKRAFITSIMLILGWALFAGGGSEESGRPDRDTITMALSTEPESLDPIVMNSSPAANVSRHVSQPLASMTTDGDLVPLLATAWEPAPDNLSWTFTLRRNVSFHDGTPFNAQAVKANLDRFLDPANSAPFAFLLGEIASVDIVDDYTLRLSLNRPFAPIVSHLTHPFTAIVSPEQLKTLAPGEFITAPVGTGPYRFVEWRRGESIHLEANTEYFGEIPPVPNITFRFIPENSARVVALETGEVDVITNLPPNDARRLEDTQGLSVAYPSSVRVLYIGFNTSREPFSDPRVRRALNYAVNKEAIVNTILQGSGRVSTAPVVSAVFGHAANEPYPYDPERARELLAEAGYADGFEVDFYHPTGRYPLDATIAEAVQGMLAEVGVTARLNTAEWSSYLSSIRVPPEDSVHDMLMFGWGTVTMDADYGLYAMFHGSVVAPGGWNTVYYADETVDDILSRARAEANPDERLALYREVGAILWEDAPWLFLHDVGQINGHRSDIRGLIHHPRESLFLWDAEFVQ